jgi:hypothetical protein
LGGALVSTIPLGLGIALNPVAIVASILILRSANARLNAVAFLLGWIAGMGVLVILASRLVQVEFGALRGRLLELPGLILIALGALLLAAAVWSFRRRPPPESDPAPSPLLHVLDRAGTAPKVGAGVLLATVSLRNLALLAAASALIGQSELSLLELTLTVVVFVFASSLGVLIPLLMRLFGGQGADARLETSRRWLLRHMSAITAVVLATLGAYLLVRGLLSVWPSPTGP